MSERKFAADKIAKKFIPKYKDIEDEQNYSAEESEEENIKPTIQYNPSKIRKDALSISPKYNFEEEEYYSEQDDGYSHDDGTETETSDLLDVEAENIEDLENQLNEIENQEGVLISSIKQQQEEDKKIASGTAQLQKHYEHLLRLRLKMQSLLNYSNQLPPIFIDNIPNSNLFEIASSDKEVAKAFEQASESISKVNEDMKDLKSLFSKYYEFDNVENKTDHMMDIISHWGQKVRLGSGFKHGSVINRPIEQQIASLLKDRNSLIQPSKHVIEKKIFGLDSIPDILSVNYTDVEFYQKLLRDIVTEKKPEISLTKVQNPQKHQLKSKQISYDVIPELQNYMIPTMEPIPDYVDALFSSLMK